MGKNKRMMRLFFVLFLGTAFIFSFSHFGAQAFGSKSNSNETFSNGTFIGAFNISGKMESEAISILSEKDADWVKSTNISLQFQKKMASIDLNGFHLDAKQTVDSIKNGQSNLAVLTIDQSKVKEQLRTLLPELKSSDVDVNKLTASLNQIGAKFQPGTYNLDLNHYLLSGKMDKETVLSIAKIPLKEIPEGLPNVIKNNSRIEVSAGAMFSLLDYVKAKKVKLTSDVLNLLATGIYEAILPTNIEVAERNISNTLPDYAELGYEARVRTDINEDLKIINPNKEKVEIEITLVNQHLQVSLIGKKFLYTYKITKKDEQTLLPKTIIQFSPLLQPGQTMVQSNGKEGRLVKVYRDIYQDGQLIKSEFLSEDYYPPVFRVEIHGLSEPSSNQIQESGNQGNATSGSQSGANPVTQTNESTNNSKLTSVDIQSGTK